MLLYLFFLSRQSPHPRHESAMGTVRRDVRSSAACAKPGGQLTQHLPGCVCARWTMPLSPATECSLRAPTPELRPWNSYRHSWSWRARSLSLFPLANGDNKSREEQSAISASIFSRSHSRNTGYVTWVKLELLTQEREKEIIHCWQTFFFIYSPQPLVIFYSSLWDFCIPVTLLEQN